MSSDLKEDDLLALYLLQLENTEVDLQEHRKEFLFLQKRVEQYMLKVTAKISSYYLMILES